MKQLLALVVCAVLLSGLVSCQDANRGVKAGVEGDGEFPEFLVGVWFCEGEDYNWGFRFEADGTISKVEHMLAGKMDMEDGINYMEGPDEGTFALFVMGPCEAKYDPTNRRLSVKVVLERFHMRLPQGDLEGYNEDYFDGPVSENGKFWIVDWRDYSWLEGATPPDANLIEAHPERLIFTKLDIE